MSVYTNAFKAQIIKSIIGAFSGAVARNEACIEEHDHDLTKNPWQIEITFRNENDKLIKITIEIEDATR